MTVYQGDLRELVTEPGEPLDRPYILCPLHEDKHRPSMRVYADGAHCFTCGGHLHRDQFSQLFDARELTTAKLRSGMGRPKLPKRVSLDPQVVARAAHLQLRSLPVMGSPPWKYLYDRGINLTFVDKYQIGYNGVAFTLPVFDIPPFSPDYRILNVRYRRDDEVAPYIDMKYWGLRGYNDLMLYPHICDHEVAFLTEGEFDALLLRQYHLPAFSWVNGSSVMPTKEQWDAFFPALRVLIRVGDQDAAGRKGSDRLLNGYDAKGFDAVSTRVFGKALPPVPHREGFCDHFPDIPVHDVVWDERLGKDVTAVYQNRYDEFAHIVEHLERFR